MLAGFEHFRDLPIADKLRLVEDMWDDIAASSKEVPIPQHVLDEVDRRWKEIEKDPSICITEEEMWRRVDEACGQSPTT